MKTKVIYVGGDHAGFEYKEKIKPFLFDLGYEVVDCGPFRYNKDDDYPDFVIPLAKKVVKNKNSVGIILAGSGQGEAIAVNRIKGVRAMVYYGGKKKILGLSKEHNNSNILSLGARFLTLKEVKEAIKIWLKAPFSGAKRHVRRLRKIDR
jgi:ribose 5-phosphate isomerase B